MLVRIDFSGLRNRRWQEFAVRFVIGGAITVAAGLLAHRYGPAFGGLFLAFPAIFPSSVTLVEKNEREKKHKAGLDGTDRGRLAAALDTRGAIWSAIGLTAFAIICWQLLPTWNAVAVLSLGVIVWAALAAACWLLHRAL